MELSGDEGDEDNLAEQICVQVRGEISLHGDIKCWMASFDCFSLTLGIIPITAWQHYIVLGMGIIPITAWQHYIVLGKGDLYNCIYLTENY